jgi:hypothetical protein
MELIKSDMRTVTLDRFSIEKAGQDDLVEIEARLTIVVPSQTPDKIDLRVRYQSKDIPLQGQEHFGRRLLSLLSNVLG